MGRGGGFTGLANTAASTQFTTESYNSVQKHVVRNWDGPDAKAFAGIYKSNWVCSVFMDEYEQHVPKAVHPPAGR
jgi:hypothetical protein